MKFVLALAILVAVFAFAASQGDQAINTNWAASRAGEYAGRMAKMANSMPMMRGAVAAMGLSNFGGESTGQGGARVQMG